MALLETINEIQQRRNRVMARRENQMASGETPASIPVPKERLRAAMSYLDRVYKENRAKTLQQRQEQAKRTQAMQMGMQMQEQQEQGVSPQEQPQQAQPQAPQMPAQPLMGQMGMQAPQQPQSAPQGLLGMPR